MMLVTGGEIITIPKEVDMKIEIIGAENVIGAKRSSAMLMERVRDGMMAIDGLIIQIAPMDRQRHTLHGICRQINSLLKTLSSLCVLRLGLHRHLMRMIASILVYLRPQSFMCKLPHLLMNQHGHLSGKASDLPRIL
jgi:hypothetical protein